MKIAVVAGSSRLEKWATLLKEAVEGQGHHLVAPEIADLIILHAPSLGKIRDLLSKTEAKIVVTTFGRARYSFLRRAFREGVHDVVNVPMDAGTALEKILRAAKAKK